ncbi:hypothetical protein TAESTU_30080 [Tenacibaculum aestuarii]
MYKKTKSAYIDKVANKLKNLKTEIITSI